MSAAAEPEAGESSSSTKREALLLGELEGLSCKLSGYEHALEDCEFELAERELQVVLLKSFIRNLESPTDLQINLQEVLEHNTHLQQELARTTSAPPAPASTAMQLCLLRAALAEANYRLTAAGLLPVAATGLQDDPRSQEGASPTSNFTASTPIIKRSFSRLLHKYSTPSHASTSTSTSRPQSSTSSTSSTITPSGSAGSKSSPCAPALSLASKLTEAAPAEGPDTPLCATSTATAPRRTTSCSEAASSCTNTPAPGRAAATAASDLTAAVASSLSAAFSALAAVRPGGAAGGADIVKAAGDASAERTLSGFEDVEPYACATDAFSDGSSSIASRQSAPASPNMCLLGSPEGKVDPTPPCSPCSSISCDSVGGSGMRRSYAAPAGLGRSLAAWPGVTCSCDNPLFVENADS